MSPIDRFGTCTPRLFTSDCLPPGASPTLLILSGLVAMLFDFEPFEAVIAVLIMKFVNLVLMIAIMAYFGG